MYFETEGIIIFDPEDVTKKHKLQSSWKKTAMIILDCDISQYYSWFLKKRYNIILNPSLRGPHVTIINDKIDTNEKKKLYENIKNKYHGTKIKFKYNSDIRSDGNHWWLPIESNQGLLIREEGRLGKPFIGFHLSIGRADHPLMISHSHYILQLIKKGLIT